MALTVRNWSKFQHYKARRPPWIKLHRDLLENRSFLELPVASRALAPLLWLLASESEDGSLPDSPKDLAWRLRCSEAEIVSGINPLIAGEFLSGVLLPASVALAARGQHADSETEGETETEGEERKAPAEPTPLALVTLTPAKNWNAEAAEDFKAVYGVTAPPAYFKAVKDVAKKHGWAVTRGALQTYMAETPIEFLNVAKCLESKVVNVGARSPTNPRARERVNGLNALISGGLKGDGT
jgi:hypothetical protein